MMIVILLDYYQYFVTLKCRVCCLLQSLFARQLLPSSVKRTLVHRALTVKLLLKLKNSISGYNTI